MEAKAQFTDTVKVEWLESNCREMRLTHPVSFIDTKGVCWYASAGQVVDGASIPKFLWVFVGSPFVGRYRRASVIHDVFCKHRNRPHKSVHKMFHEAMLIDGVKKKKAKMMYNAVKTFGPRW